VADALLEARDLRKRFGGVAATDGVSLTVAAGELHALIGPNGAGKTTLIHQLSGALRPDHGSIVFGGRDVTRTLQYERVALGLARSYQITSIFANFTALQNIVLAVQARSGSSMRFWRAVAKEKLLYDEARSFLEQVGLGARAHVPARDLAHGEQRQLEVGLALATRARLLLLDEPMAGLGPDESRAMTRMIAKLKGSVTVLLVEHDMTAVFELAERISVLVAGRIIASGVPQEIRANAQVRRAYLGDEVAA
jgi:branched-chain amino acid transport system ATP-binding protein